MASFNRVILLGNLTRDVDVRYTQGGTAVTEVGLAVNDRVKRNGEWVDEVTFVDVTLWGRTAEVAGEYLSKGSPVMIEGRLKFDTWEQEGQKRSKLAVVGERMQMVGGRSGGPHSGGQGNASSGQSTSGQSTGGQSTGGQTGGSRAATPQPSGNAETGQQSGGPIPEDDIPF